MALTVTALKRVFKMGATRLEDIDPSMSPEQVREAYAENFPHLANAAVGEATVDGDTLVYEFVAEPVKTKG